MKALLLAAGFGTRLRPLSGELPKPVWPFFDVPVAAHALRALAEAGVPEVVVNLHHLPERLKETLAPWTPEGVRVLWSHEEEILGTGGAVRACGALLATAPFFLVNADTYQEIDLAAMARAHRRRAGLATLALRRAPPTSAAPIEVDRSGRVVGFLGARAPGSRPGSGCQFTGVHVLEPRILDHLPEGRSCINADVHQRLVARGEPLFGYFPPVASFWSDLGTPGAYLDSHRQLLARVRIPPGAPGRLVLADEGGEGRVIAPSYLGSGARVERGGVAGPFAVLGAGARVLSGGRVADSVLWPDASAGPGEVRRTILSASGLRMAVSG